jgi:hypothetical protein
MAVRNKHVLKKPSLLRGLARVVAKNPSIDFIVLKTRES